MSTLLAIDPSIAAPGAAVFVDAVLVWAGYLTIRKDDRQILDRCELAARRLVDSAVHAFPWRTLSHVVVEFPEVYADTRVNANELLKLAAMAGAATARVVEIADGRPEISSPRPREWCKNLPKCKSGSYWKSPRGARVQSRLSPAEFALVPDQKDAGDAVALGLWRLGRFAPINVRLR